MLRSRSVSQQFKTFYTVSVSRKTGSVNGKCDLEDRCSFKVILRKEWKKGGKPLGSDQSSVSKDSIIFDHSRTWSTLGSSSKQLTKSMVYNSQLTQRMVSSCKNVNDPEITLYQINLFCSWLIKQTSRVNKRVFTRLVTVWRKSSGPLFETHTNLIKMFLIVHLFGERC